MRAGEFLSGFETGFGCAFLTSVLERLATLGGFSWKHIGLIWGVDDELKKLHRIFSKIQDLLEYVECSSERLFGGRGWSRWFEDLRKVAYDADILLDDISLHVANSSVEHGVQQETPIFPQIISSLSKLNFPSEISNMQNKPNELLTELESLIMVEKLNGEEGEFGRLADFNDSTSFVNVKTVVGRDSDKDCILRFLKASDVYVLPIVGMGGIGKSTLARMVYHDETVSTLFDMRLWVQVTADFDIIRITRSIIEQLSRKTCMLSDLNALQTVLRDLLQCKKLLLVLDDYWSESPAEWGILFSPFRFGSKNSKVIITTQSLKASSTVSSCEAHRLRILSDDDCWEVIKQKTLLRLEANENLELIGKDIAKKCKGVPLVATTYGDMLGSKSTEREWNVVLSNELTDMTQDVFRYLIKSYRHLSPHLRRCFSYCSIFPATHKYDVDELVLLWIAEGFIIPVGTKRLENLGREYFDQLCSRSLFENPSNPRLYTMHGLTHDMARLIARDFCFHSMSSNYPLFGYTCHLGLLNESSQPLQLKASQKNERLRSFFVINSNAQSEGEIASDFFSNCKSLRVLGLSNLSLTELPKSFRHLKYLRYLTLSDNLIVRLPESICKFVALQTLKLRKCLALQKLPSGIINLFNLRHLELDEECMLASMPLQFGRLSSLQTLTLYVVGTKHGHRIDELSDMNCLGGSLCIRNVELVRNEGNAGEAMLHKKAYLNTLELRWNTLRDGLENLDQEMEHQAAVLGFLTPHRNLKEMVIKDYCGMIYPDWLTEPGRVFTRIHLEGLRYCNKLPCLGELPCLKTFVIKKMPSLVDIDDDFYGTISNTVKFPLLESFEVVEMLALTHWMNVSDSAMPSLTFFAVSHCPNLISFPQRLCALLHISYIHDCPNLEP